MHAIQAHGTNPTILDIDKREVNLLNSNIILAILYYLRDPCVKYIPRYPQSRHGDTISGLAKRSHVLGSFPPFQMLFVDFFPLNN